MYLQKKNNNLRVVISWDDGHPLDLKINELLKKYNHSCTYFIPNTNCENYPVLNNSQIRELSVGNEIGSHTFNHAYLNLYKSVDDAFKSIEQGKFALEDILNKKIEGFCYPGGIYNNKIIDYVKRLNFSYARTTRCFNTGVISNLYLIPVSFQFFPHSKLTYLKNFITLRDYSWNSKLILNLLKNVYFTDKFMSFIYESINLDYIIHVWGHSFEIEKYGLWNDFEIFLKFLYTNNIRAESINKILVK